MKRFYEDVTRQVKIGKHLYRITRQIDHPNDFTEFFVDQWNGRQWNRVHYWASR